MSEDWKSGGNGNGGSSSNGSGPGKSPAKASTSGPAGSRMRAISQLRQVLRSTPGSGRGSAVALDIFLLLRYLPVGMTNKLAQLSESITYFVAQEKDAAGAGSSSSVPGSGSKSGSGPEDKDGKKQKNEAYKKASEPDKKKVDLTKIPVTPLGTPIRTQKPLATSIPIDVIPPPTAASVLQKVLQINSQNNKVIEAKIPTQEEIDPKLAPHLEEEGIRQIEPVKESEMEGKKKRPVEKTFLETNLFWQNVEARTKHLVLSVQKAATLGSSTSSKHNLITFLDELFSHIYQHHETRSTAVEAGALKVLAKVVKDHPQDTYIVHRSREILALLGLTPATKGHGIKILAIDGGGVRGLVALEVLRSIERVTGKRVYELFDYICGVSTGSILAFLLGAHKKTLDEAELLYKDLSQEIFTQNSFLGSAALLWSHSYYHTPTFERILKKHCGEMPLISLARDAQLPRVSAISTVVNQERVCPYVFRTYAFPPTVRSTYLGGCRYHMWEAVRASAAAPTYFEEIKLGNYLHQDGGVLCNNPTSVAISEARTLWKDQPLQCVVSLGTGLMLSSRTDKNLSDLLEPGKDGMSYLSWKGKFLKVLDSATDTESVHNTLSELLPPSIYFRFNPYLSDVVRLDEASSEKLDRVQSETRAYLERNVEKVQFACKTLQKEKGFSKKISDWWYHNH